MENQNAKVTENNLTKSDRKVWLFRIVSTLMTIAFCVLFFMNSKFYRFAKRTGLDSIKKKNLLIFLVGTLMILLVIYVKNFLSDKWNRVIAYGMLAFTPYFVVRMMDYMIKACIGSKKELLFNMLIIATLLLFVLLISNSIKISVISVAVFCEIFALVNFFVNQFRGTPMLVADLFTAKTAANVLDGYSLQITFRVFLSMYIVFGFCLFVCRLRNTRLINRKKLRIVFSVASVISLCALVYAFVFSPMLDEVYIKLFNPIVSYRLHGTALTFVRSINYILIEKPDGYSLEAVKELVDEYSVQEVQMGLATEEAPNVISIVNEAFADLSYVVDGLETNQDYMPFVHSLKENAVTGKAYVSIRGGQTANSEYEYLTGNTMAFFPPQSVPFQLYVKEETVALPGILEQLGYVGNLAYHPHFPSGYKRDVVYPLLGFDKFYSRADFMDAEKVGIYTSDKGLYDRIIADYESFTKKSDEPFNAYAMTMQNHSPYNRDMTGLDSDAIVIENKKQKNKLQQNYLNFVYESDKAIEQLVSYFEKEEDPTVLVFFGDHQQRIPAAYLKKATDGEAEKWVDGEMVERRYTVPFFIWTNFDSEEMTYDKVSLNYLSSMVMDIAGQKKTGYQNFLSQMQKEVPAITANGYFGADGEFYNISDTESPYYEWIKKYKILQYNNVYDSKNRMEEFFLGEK